MKFIMRIKSIDAPSGLNLCPTNKYVLNFESLPDCKNRNCIKYIVVTEKIKHDISEDISFDELIKIYQ